MKIKGLEFFPVSSHNTYEMDLIEAKYGLDAIGIYFKLLQKVFGGTGYYAKVDEYFTILLAKESGVEEGKVKAIIDECIKIGMFEKEMYDTYKILTNGDIQEDYMIAVRGRSIVEMEEKYLIGNSKEKYQKLKEKANKSNFGVELTQKSEEFTQKSEEFTQNFDRREEKKQEEKKQEDKIQEDKIQEEREDKVGGLDATPEISLSPHANETLIKKTDNEYEIINTRQRVLSDIEYEKFKIAFTNKRISKGELVPNNFDIYDLVQSVNESDFLKTNDNLDFKWLINNYDRVINGEYKTYKKETPTRDYDVMSIVDEVFSKGVL